MSHPHHTHTDPRDHLIPVEGINTIPHYVVYSVFRIAGPLHDSDTAATEKAILDTGVSIRGWYDIGGFCADADLMLQILANDPHLLQAAYHMLHDSGLGRDLEPVWSCIGVHQPAEFNRGHTPVCFSGVAPHPWVCVYLFVRSCEWYYMDEEHHSKMLVTHGRVGREYPDVPGSITSAFALNGYEWLLALGAGELYRLTDAMRHQRGAEARLHVRKEIPFSAGPRVTLGEWAYHQPHS